MKPATVIFLHGLNTYADGLVHLGPFTFGNMSRSWKHEFEKRGFNFVDVAGIGFGAVEEQTDQALKSLIESGALNNDCHFHLFGHSMGGLVARVLAHRPELKGRVKSIMTIGTPHNGAEITSKALALQNSSPYLYRFMKFFGYDVVAKRKSLENFTTETLKAVTDRYSDISGIRCVSFIGSATFEQLCPPYKVIYTRLHPAGPRVESDGFIMSESQKWGEVWGKFELDHMAEIGVFWNLNAKRRKFASQEFQRLASAAEQVINESN